MPDEDAPIIDPRSKGPRTYKFEDPEEAYKAVRRAIINAPRWQEKSLDLSRFGLKRLPPEIGELTALRSLDLNGNQLTALRRKSGN